MAMTRNKTAVVLLSLLVLCSLCPANVPDNGTWVFVTIIPGSPRGACGVAVLDGTIYVAGGNDGHGSMSASLDAYDLVTSTTGTWLAGKAAMTNARHGLGLAAHDGKLYAIGGSPAYNVRTDVVEEYDPISNTWSPKTSMPTARVDLGVKTIGDAIFALGGDIRGTGTPNVEKYDPGSDCWTSVASLPFMLAGMGTATVDGLLYSVAGSSAHPVDTIYRYDPDEDEWTDDPVGHTPTVLGQHGTRAGDDGFIYVAGGYDNLGGPVDSFWRYSPDADTWTELPPLLGPASYVDLVQVDGTLYLVDGYAGTIHAYVVTIPGDANGDGAVDDLDLTALVTHWQQYGGLAEGDFNGDGFISQLDLTVLATAWPGGPGPDASGTTSGGDVSAVPEPATLSLLALLALSLPKGGGLALVCRKHRGPAGD